MKNITNKSITPEQLYATLLKLVSPLKPLPCQTVDSIVFIKPENIAFITAVAGSLDVMDIEGKKWKRFDSITAICEKFKADTMFFKANRGAVINLRQVKALYTTQTGSREVTFRTLEDSSRVSISDNVYPAFKKAMGLVTDEPEKKNRNA